MTTTRTTCPYCGVGCGVLATPRADGRVDIKADPDHPANFGRLCSKGAALGETLSLDDRLLHPLVGSERTNWDAALGLVASRFADAIAQHGPDSVAFYVSGQILTEDYYVANKLMKGFIGSANIDTNSRLCMASSVAGHKRAFGSDTVPGCYEDLDQADLVVLVGSNLAWCHPVLFQRLVAAKEARGTKIVVIDPRRTATAEIADLHLALAPGSDVALFNGLLLAIAGGNATDLAFLDAHTSGFAEAFQSASKMSLREIAQTTGLSAVQLHAFYDLFVRTERTVTVYSQGVNQSVAGTDKVNAIINCHLATGRIGRPGMAPFSVTGQPNAMGGREAGGLANMLAAHMELTNPEHRRIVQAFWQSPKIADKPGLKAVDMFRAVGDGRIKALWVMATNPVDSMPDADAVRAALAACPFVVVSDVARNTDTTAHAHVLLPALAWGEKSGTVTNSERRVSRQRSFLKPPGEARADWWQMAEVGRRMGFADAFAWTSAAEVFDEYARLTAFENSGQRDLDLGNVTGLTAEAYETLAPLQWPHGQARLFGNGGFFTADRRGRFVATPYRPLARPTTPDYPLVLNTGRIRDQWHTMTRTAKTARLMSHIAEPFLEIHPEDAATFGLSLAKLAHVTSPHGNAVLRIVVTPRQRKGSVFAPIHWTNKQASNARVDALITDAVDPVSGQPELKGAPVSVRAFPAEWFAFAVSVATPFVSSTDYWATARAPSGWRAELAGLKLIDDWTATARTMLQISTDIGLLAYHDAKRGQYRCAAFDGERLVGALFVAREPVAVSRSWLTERLGTAFETSQARLSLLAGRTGEGSQDKGAIVCACFDVGRNQILASFASGHRSMATIGLATQAGTNCGSCRTEIGRLINGTYAQKAS
jgi:assimilatory nitrate reductase catalytic subunit